MTIRDPLMDSALEEGVVAEGQQWRCTRCNRLAAPRSMAALATRPKCPKCDRTETADVAAMLREER